MELIFASNNKHKIEETKAIISGDFKIISLAEAGIDIDIPEPHATLEANATEKSTAIYNLTGKDCFSEDTGLEVEALGGEPGVLSARYAGENKSAEKNIEKLLLKMDVIQNRAARFKTIISLIIKGKEHTFEGICKGTIIAYTSGKLGFGYDPVFLPDGSSKTLAEMKMDEKNNFSHRKNALIKMIGYLKQQTY